MPRLQHSLLRKGIAVSAAVIFGSGFGYCQQSDSSKSQNISDLSEILKTGLNSRIDDLENELTGGAKTAGSKTTIEQSRNCAESFIKTLIFTIKNSPKKESNPLFTEIYSMLFDSPVSDVLSAFQRHEEKLLESLKEHSASNEAPKDELRRKALTLVLGAHLYGLNLEWEESFRILEALSQIDPEWSEIHMIAGLSRSALGRNEEAQISLEKAIASEPDLVNRLGMMLMLAQIHEKLGESDKAEEICRTGLKQFRDSSSPVIEFELRFLERLVSLELSRGDLKEAEKLIRERIRIVESHKGKDSPEIVILYHQLGDLLLKEGLLEDAEKIFRRVLEVENERGEAGSKWAVIAALSLADVLEKTDRAKEFEELLRKSIETAENHDPVDLWGVGIQNDRLGHFLAEKGRNAEGAEFLQRSVEIDEALLGSEHLDVADSLLTLAIVLQETDQTERTEKTFRRALEIQQSVLGPSHLDIADTQVIFAQFLVDQDQFDEAESLLTSALQITQKKLGEKHPETALCLFDLAQCLKLSGQSEDALPFAEKSLTILFEVSRTDRKAHPDLRVVTNNLREIYRDLGLSSDQTGERIKLLLHQSATESVDED